MTPHYSKIQRAVEEYALDIFQVEWDRLVQYHVQRYDPTNSDPSEKWNNKGRKKGYDVRKRSRNKENTKEKEGKHWKSSSRMVFAMPYCIPYLLTWNNFLILINKVSRWEIQYCSSPSSTYRGRIYTSDHSTRRAWINWRGGSQSFDLRKAPIQVTMKHLA